MLSEDRAWWNIWLDGVVLMRQELVEVGIGIWWWCHWDPFTKNKPAEAGEVDGRMKPFASSSSTYFFMASASGCDKGNILPLGGVLLGISSMEQSLERCGGSSVAFTLLNASRRSAYWEGRWTTSECPWVRVMVLTVTGMLWLIHCSWQADPHCLISPSFHEM